MDSKNNLRGKVQTGSNALVCGLLRTDGVIDINMDITYRPPMQMPQECEMLEKNYVTCLHEKALKDVDVPMKCDVERVSSS
jgi:hypothetical protein